MFPLNYPIQLEAAEEGGYVVTFPDVPEAITQGENEAEALMHAIDALETALSFYTDAGSDLPQPSAPCQGQSTVRPSLLAGIKLAIYQTMRSSK